MNDFVSAIRSKSIEKCAEESTRYFKEDWKSLLEILDQMMVHSSFTNRIEEITSVLNRVCMPRKSYLTESASQFTEAATLRKKWFGSPALKNENVPMPKYSPQVNSLYDMKKPCKLSKNINPV